MRGISVGSSREELCPWEELTLEKFMEDCLPWEDPTLEQGKSARCPPPREKGGAEIMCGDPASTLILHPPVCPRRKEEKN